MAKTIATIGGVGLRPGISRNRRLYTAEAVAHAVAKAQERIKQGAEPMIMLTHHAAGDQSREIAGRLTSMSLDEDGNARYTAVLADTAAGRDIASLADTSDGQEPHLRGVSIRGHWVGPVRRMPGPDGHDVETAAQLELDGLDFTRSPGVPGAEVDTFAWADAGGRTETSERIAITESAEALVTITEETAPLAERKPDPALAEMASADLTAPHVLEDGICVTCPVAEGGDAPGDGSKPYGDVPYADPGYQSDKKKRYPLDTKAHARSALAYISKKANAAKYSPQQLKRVKGRILAACKKFGISTAPATAETASWVFDDPAWLAERVAECDPGLGGSYCLTASNGPTNISVSDYSLDPSELAPILRAAVEAACAALATLDPDMDGDIDVPGATASDTDHDGGESAPDDEPETETDPAASPAAAINTKEESEMTDTTTPAEQAAPALDPKILAEAIAAGLAQHEEARAAREAAERKAAEEAAEKAAAEAAAQESADARIARLVAEGVKNALASEQHAEDVAAATETEDQKVSRLVSEALVTERQKLAEAGVGTGRKGLTTGAVDEHRAPRTDGGTPELNAHGMPGTFPDKAPKDLSATELRRHAAPYLAGYVFGDRAQKFG